MSNLNYLKLQNNCIKNWNAVKNGLIGWQGIEFNIYLTGNPFIDDNEIENLKIGWENEIMEISDQLKIVWE